MLLPRLKPFVFLLLASICVNGYAEVGSQGIVFRFAPTDSVVSVIRVTSTTTVYTDKTNRSESRKETQIEFRRTEGGYVLEIGPELSGDPEDSRDEKWTNPAIVRYELSDEGNVIEISGIDDLNQEIFAEFPALADPAFSSVFDVKEDRDARELKWKRRVTDFVGREVSIGDSWEYKAPFGAPDRIYDFTATFAEEVIVNGVRCVRIEYGYHWEGEVVDEFDTVSYRVRDTSGYRIVDPSTFRLRLTPILGPPS
jgi:hypothetical protein